MRYDGVEKAARAQRTFQSTKDMNSIWNDIKLSYQSGHMITRLVIINVAVFLVVNLVKLVLLLTAGFSDSPLFTTFLEYIVIHSDWVFNLTHPWVIFTHMFVHVGLFHILFNMLFLFWFGRIVGDLLGDRRILPLYLLGGLAGAFIAQLISPFAYPNGNIAYGASAAVMAIIGVAGSIAPDFRIRLMFIGEVALKWIVLALVVIDLLGVANNSNTGGHFAHLGGFAFGWLYVYVLRERGYDMTKPVTKLLDWFVETYETLVDGKKPQPRFETRRSASTQKTASSVVGKMKRTVQSRTTKGSAASDYKSDEERVDDILDKIKKTGYDSLTSEEKAFLFKVSSK